MSSDSAGVQDETLTELADSVQYKHTSALGSHLERCIVLNSSKRLNSTNQWSPFGKIPQIFHP